ncbi:hypothetical protein Bca52824_023086 [Brassica carinata]|uniref:Uncharacterized protein n=1 Tax=Brassica carinata TaxID=52824 RepID=A0A8X8AS65_BRACI|nr:hypothetical protein Bca52824_023086 [Brassica carinata]
MCLIHYDDCIKDCDKAVERDRNLRPGKEQLCRRWKKYRQVTAKNGWFCWLCYFSAHPLLRCTLLSLKLRVWIGRKPVEGNVETELESSAMEGRVRYLATNGGERMRFETCPSKKKN